MKTPANPRFFLCSLMMVLSLLCIPDISVARSGYNPKVNTVIEQIDFRDVTLGDALKVLSEQSELNIIASKEAALIPVTMYLRRVTAMEVIEALSKTYNLWFQHDVASNIVRIYTVKEYRLEQVEFKREETDIFTMKNAKNALDFAETIQNLFSGRVKLSYGQNQQQLMIDMAQRFARFDMIDNRKKQQLTQNINGGGNRNTTTGSLNYQNLNNNQTGQGVQGNQGNLLTQGRNANGQGVNDALTNLESAVGGIGTSNPDSVGNMLTGDSQESRELVDSSIRHQAPIYVGVIKHQNRVLVRTRDIDAMNEIRSIQKELDMESSMLLLEVKVLSVDLSDGFDSLFDIKAKSGDFNVSTINGTQAIGARELLDAGIRAAAASMPNPAMLATVITENFEARLQLAEKENRVTSLATPMVLTSNQEVSSFLMGSQIPVVVNYTAGSTTVTSAGNTAISQTLPPAPVYEQRTIGNTLFLTPNINADGTVSIAVVVEEASLVKNGATIIVPVENAAPQTQSIDVVSEKTFSGSVIAKSGTSVAVGGMIEEGAGGDEKKVPILGDIPLLGFFFREEHQTRGRTELVILIKPHIISSPLEAEAVSQHVLQQNSVHPNVDGEGSMNIYTNPDHQHKGYKLEQPFKEYNDQDSLDRYQWDNVNPLR